MLIGGAQAARYLSRQFSSPLEFEANLCSTGLLASCQHTQVANYIHPGLLVVLEATTYLLGTT
jgi:hypothetical protein